MGIDTMRDFQYPEEIKAAHADRLVRQHTATLGTLRSEDIDPLDAGDRLLSDLLLERSGCDREEMQDDFKLWLFENCEIRRRRSGSE